MSYRGRGGQFRGRGGKYQSRVEFDPKKKWSRREAIREDATTRSKPGVVSSTNSIDLNDDMQAILAKFSSNIAEMEEENNRRLKIDLLTENKLSNHIKIRDQPASKQVDTIPSKNVSPTSSTFEVSAPPPQIKKSDLTSNDLRNQINNYNMLMIKSEFKIEKILTTHHQHFFIKPEIVPLDVKFSLK